MSVSERRRGEEGERRLRRTQRRRALTPRSWSRPFASSSCTRSASRSSACPPAARPPSQGAQSNTATGAPPTRPAGSARCSANRGHSSSRGRRRRHSSASAAPSAAHPGRSHSCGGRGVRASQTPPPTTGAGEWREGRAGSAAVGPQPRRTAGGAVLQWCLTHLDVAVEEERVVEPQRRPREPRPVGVPVHVQRHVPGRRRRLGLGRGRRGRQDRDARDAEGAGAGGEGGGRPGGPGGEGEVHRPALRPEPGLQVLQQGRQPPGPAQPPGRLDRRPRERHQHAAPVGRRRGRRHCRLSGVDDTAGRGLDRAGRASNPPPRRLADDFSADRRGGSRHRSRLT